MFYLIQEAPFSCNLSLIESKTMFNGMPKLRIGAIIMMLDTKSANNRIYPRHVVERAINESVSKLVSNKALLGEIDHPIVDLNLQSIKEFMRQVMVLNDYASHLFLDIKLTPQNTVEAVIETLSTDKGWKLAGLISDGVKVGFSVRAVGRLTEGTNQVAWPLSIVTFDATSNPAFEQARVVKIQDSLIESFISNKQNLALAESVSPAFRYFIENVLNSDRPSSEKVRILNESGIFDRIEKALFG